MAEHDDSNDKPVAPPAVLRDDGLLEQLQPLAQPTAFNPEAGPPAKDGEEKLELDAAALAHAFPAPSEPKPGRRFRIPPLSLKPLVGAAAVLAFAVAAFLVARGFFGQGASGTALLVDSVPPGAAITIDGKRVGQTPWAGNNDWAPGKHQLRVEKQGYRPAELEVRGAREEAVSIKLTPK